MEGYGALKLTERCRGLLRGELRLDLRTLAKPDKAKDKSARKASAMRPCDAPLFEALRALRRELAEEQGVPPYVIFHDTTLQEMARTRPTALEQMRYIAGVGEQKLKRYGQRFLTEVARHPLPALLDNPLSDTVNETLALHLQGKDVVAIARERELKPSTIYTHFAEAAEAGLLNPRELLALDDAQYAEIVNTLEMLDAAKEGRLKPAYETLDKKYDYGILRCVLAGL
jgi:ATP-dependent DNA helicase RecQ